MNIRIQPVQVIVVAGLLLAFAAYEANKVRQNNKLLQAQSAENLRSEQQARQHLQERTKTENELKAARQKLAEIGIQQSAGDSNQDPTERALVQRANRIRQLFAARPELATPELELVSSVDWLKIAGDADLETEPGIRRAMAAARYRATEQFFAKLKPALATVGTTRTAWPRTVNELAADLGQPLNTAYFRRYRMLIDGDVIPATLRAALDVVAEVAPIDPQYDLTQPSLNTSGGTNRTPWAMTPLRDAMQEGRLAYVRANGGSLSGDYSAFVKPPFQQLMRARTQFTAETKHRGPIEGTMLAPYLATDEERAAAEKIWPKLEAAK